MMLSSIFDLDGVIVDTAGFHYRAWCRLASELGFEFGAADNERLKGVSRMRSLDILLEVGGLADRFDDESKRLMADRKNRWYLDYVNQMTPADILPGVRELIDDLHSHGVTVALGSASRNAAIILRRVGISDMFDAVVDGNDVTNAKPDPQVFLLAAERLGVAPSDCIVFEDAAAGIEAAHRAGMRSVGIGSPDHLSHADAVLPSLEKVTYNYLKNRLYE